MIIARGKTGNALRRFPFLSIPAALLIFGMMKAQTDGSDVQTDTVSVKEKAGAYLWPTNASRSLASSFAETRANHFHFGIDIRTQQRTGYPCYAVANGYVARLKVSPYGYGRVLYLQLEDGNMAVYAHLQRFTPEVEKIIHAEQVKSRLYRCELFLQPDQLPFKKGDIVAYTGSSGVGSPHLHFEMRDGQGYRNPLPLGFAVPDTIPPVPQRIAFCALSRDSEINDDFRTVMSDLVPSNPNHFQVSKVPSVYGPMGIEISGYDQVDESGNQISFWGLDLYLDGEFFFSTRYDYFKYDEEKQIDIDRDYRLRKMTGDAYHHLWKDPSATVGFYKKGDGVIDTREFNPGLHHYEIVLSDFAGNEARVKGRLEFKEQSLYPPIEAYSNFFGFFTRRDNPGIGAVYLDMGKSSLKAEFFEDFILLSAPGRSSATDVRLTLLEPYVKQIPIVPSEGLWIGKIPLQPFPSGYWTVELQSNGTSDTAAWLVHPLKTGGGTVVSDDGLFRATFDKNSLYRTIYLRVSDEIAAAENHFVSRVYDLDPDDMPLRGNVRVSINIPDGEAQPEQLGIYGLSPKGVWKFLDNDRRKVEGCVTGSSPRLERYVMRRDSEPPRAIWLSPAAATSQRRPTFKLSVRDELSGFDDRSINLEVDGRFVLMEYDPEASTVFGSPDDPLAAGEHQVALTLRDFCGNETRLQRKVTITR
ncbi:MAG TPA: M23 family metallopeptidase [bacterium]